jgi:hypothetical protein
MYTSMMRKALFGSGDSALLSLDFTAGTVPTAVTFTGADSTPRATFIDSSGYVKTVASAGAARFDFDPVSLTARGLLVENNVTNFVTQSQALSGYQNYGMIAISVDGTVTDPMGGTNAKKIAASATTGIHQWLRFIVAGTATTVTVSIFAKKNNYKYLYLSEGTTSTAAARFNLETGVVDNTIGPGFVSASATPHVNGWWRCSITQNITAGSNRGWSFSAAPDGGATYNVNSASYTGTGNSNDGIYAIGFQVEEGTSASSYIPTTTAALTRLADDAVIRSTAWTSLYAQPGAMVVEFYRGAYGAGDRSVLATDTTAARHWELLHANGSATSQIAFSSGSAVTQTGLVSGLNKVALAWNAPSPTAAFDLCVNGATPTFGGSNVGTTLSTWLTLGSQSTTGVSGSGTWDNYLNNSIKSVKYYSGLTYAEMQAKTT